MEYPKRKHIRLKDYDYSQAGIYFVTICTRGRKKILSEVVRPQNGWPDTVGRGLAPAAIHLTDCGRLVEKEWAALSDHYPSVYVEKYVIMPNHFHGLLCLRENAAGASPRPTLMQVLGAFKSLTTRQWNERTGRSGTTLWQSGYHDHIIRDEEDFLRHWTYIDQNPALWAEDEYYTETP